MRKSVTVLDYDLGNIRSVTKALESLGAEVTVTNDPSVAQSAARLVVPGVGAFGTGMRNLRARGLDEVIQRIVEAGRPVLGICLGLQMLFDFSEELGHHQGLRILRGWVTRFPVLNGLPIPHMGWNKIRIWQREPLFRSLPDEPMVYFVHSYFPVPDEPSVISATSVYGVEFTCAVSHGNLHGTQFHPEKSSQVGLTILKNFLSL
ncbi:MAG: imidazole glycerol phosphate synthase subunit HisH [Armatimonadetes bacterium]|nr:imidazole glycerol phosphate synthase subunit HisH [Armatimonadota bacterium]MDW8122578.1 imidazole glycerol phosphate synthase subunit HisH [Armatimonadota bacterium]